MITILYDWLKEKDNDLATGLAAGLAAGLAFGLAAGMVVGLFNLSELIPNFNIYYSIFLLITIFILGELLFGLNKKEKNISLKRVLWLKTDALFSSALIIINLLNLFWLGRQLTKEVFQEILRWIGYIGAGIIVLAMVGAIIYGWLLLNKRRLDITEPEKKVVSRRKRNK